MIIMVNSNRMGAVIEFVWLRYRNSITVWFTATEMQATDIVREIELVTDYRITHDGDHVLREIVDVKIVDYPAPRYL